jgi:leader peptidase (prepilin peptidase)/N-methyltransferase
MIAIKTVFYIFAFLYGIVIGSFMNVIIYRLPRKIPFVSGRSVCTSCSYTLKYYDLIPVLSFILLKGKCRNCGEKISWQYIVVELLTGLLYLAAYHQYGLTLYSFGWYIALPVLIAIAFIDAEHRIIPDSLNIALAVAGLLMLLSGYGATITSRVIGIFSVSVPFLIVAMVSKGGAMGGGDIKLVAASGLCLGWQMNLIAVFIGSLVGSVAMIISMMRGKANRKSQVPFGPWLSLGIVISGLFGSYISILF